MTMNKSHIILSKRLETVNRIFLPQRLSY